MIAAEAGCARPSSRMFRSSPMRAAVARRKLWGRLEILVNMSARRQRGIVDVVEALWDHAMPVTCNP